MRTVTFEALSQTDLFRKKRNSCFEEKNASVERDILAATPQDN